jgi:Kef-type K+ transport system membrane component KefB
MAISGIPFVLGLVLAPWLVRPTLAGQNGNRISLTIILAVGVAVTSVPVVSKIFADLKILHTRFARLVLGVAVLEDIVLWLALAIATALAGKAVLNPRQMSYHLFTTVGFFALGLTIIPRIVKRINKAQFNVLAKQSPVAYAIAVLLAYCVVAGALDVSLVFAAFLAGFAVVHKKRRLFAEALDAIGKVSFAFFIPVYFAIVGLKLDLIRGFSLWMTLAFIGGSCVVKIASVSLAGRFAGFRGLDLFNLAITTNARGGPGIVLASVAFDVGIIRPKVLHDARSCCDHHIASCRCMAGLRAPQGLVIVNTSKGSFRRDHFGRREAIRGVGSSKRRQALQAFGTFTRHSACIPNLYRSLHRLTIG